MRDLSLFKCLNMLNAFQFQVDVFEIEAVDLRNVTNVFMGHDGKEAGQGWYLDKVVVSVVDEEEVTQSWTFDCQRSDVNLFILM